MLQRASKSTYGSKRGGLRMNETRMMYFEQDDVLHVAISDEPEAGSVELTPNITVELNAKGELIGIEILEASRFIRDSIVESIQGRVLHIPELQSA
jgi:uncharacterized protein YuzE